MRKELLLTFLLLISNSYCEDYQWKVCKYKSVTVHKYALISETDPCPPDWKSFCDSPPFQTDEASMNHLNLIKNSTTKFQAEAVDGVCVGLFCNFNQTLTKEFQCKENWKNFKIPTFKNSTYVYFSTKSVKTKDETESEKYVRMLKSKSKVLINKMEFDEDFYLHDLIFYTRNALEDHCNSSNISIW